MSDEKTQPDSEFDRITRTVDYQKVWERIGQMKAHRIRCDDGDGLMTVVAAIDGDLHVCIDPSGRDDAFGPPSFRARTFPGGGKYPRVRIALMLLALAITEDT